MRIYGTVNRVYSVNSVYMKMGYLLFEGIPPRLIMDFPGITPHIFKSSCPDPIAFPLRIRVFWDGIPYGQYTKLFPFGFRTAFLRCQQPYKVFLKSFNK